MKTEVVLKFIKYNPYLFSMYGLMKTEVVLKLHTKKSITCSRTFNENRSCIEIAFFPKKKVGNKGLMKTEVVLKFPTFL